MPRKVKLFPSSSDLENILLLQTSTPQPSPAPVAPSGQPPSGSNDEKFKQRQAQPEENKLFVCIVPFLVTGETQSSIQCLARELIFAYKYVPLQTTVTGKPPPILLFCDREYGTLDITEI